MSPGPGIAVWVLQQQALVAGQHVGVVVFHQAAHAHKQDLALQVELRVLRGDGAVSGRAGQPARPVKWALGSNARSGGAGNVCR